MIVKADAYAIENARKQACHVDIFLGWHRVSTWVVVDNDQRRCARLQYTCDNFARVYWRVINCPARMFFVQQKSVARVEEEQPDHLLGLVSEGYSQIGLKV